MYHYRPFVILSKAKYPGCTEIPDFVRNDNNNIIFEVSYLLTPPLPSLQ